MHRRNFMAGLGAFALLSRTAIATPTDRPGEWDGNVFHWRRANVDPFGVPGHKQDLAIALDLMGINPAHRAAIMSRIQVSIGVYTTPDEIGQIAEGHRYGAMVSGGIRSAHAWVTPNVTPHPNDSWSSTSVDVWRVTIDGTRYVLGRPHACDNWLLIEIRNGTYQCRCEPEKGDICS